MRGGKADGGFGLRVVTWINPQRTAKTVMAQGCINYILLKYAPSEIVSFLSIFANSVWIINEHEQMQLSLT